MDMMDNENLGRQYSMENIIGCEYNMDNGYVEVHYSDGNILRLKCEEIETNLHTTEQFLRSCMSCWRTRRLNLLRWHCQENCKLIVT